MCSSSWRSCAPPFLPEHLKDTLVALTIRSALVALLLLVPALIVIRETQRASTRGTAVRLSPSQYPDLYETAVNFAATLGLRRRPEIYLANGNGTLNAFAAQATGHDYVVLSNELFANHSSGPRSPGFASTPATGTVPTSPPPARPG